MSYESPNRNQSAPEFWHEAKEHTRKIAQAVNGILDGKTNNSFKVTLEAGETSTTVQFPPAKEGASAMFFPQSDQAAQLARDTNVFATVGNGTITITHGSASGGEVFSLVIVG